MLARDVSFRNTHRVRNAHLKPRSFGAALRNALRARAFPFQRAPPFVATVDVLAGKGHLSGNVEIAING